MTAGRGRCVLRAGALAIAGLVLAGGCSSPSSRAGGPRIVDLQHDASVGVAERVPGRADVLRAGQLRLTLEELLGVHGALTVQMMRKAERGDAALPGWIDALAANTAELSGAIGLVYGPAGAKAFDQLWSFHTQFFLDYADATRRDDGAAKAKALAALADYRGDFSSFIATATGGAAPESAVSELLANHIDQMVGQLDAFASDDLDGAIATERDGHAYLSTIGTTLASAISAQDPVAFPGDVNDPFAGYCSIAAGSLSDYVNAVVTSHEIGIAQPAGQRYRTTAVGGLRTAIDLDVTHVGDPFTAAGADALTEAMFGRLDRSAPGSAADISDLATLAPVVEEIDDESVALPAAVRNAYAAAYRLAQALGRNPSIATG